MIVSSESSPSGSFAGSYPWDTISLVIKSLLYIISISFYTSVGSVDGANFPLEFTSSYSGFFYAFISIARYHLEALVFSLNNFSYSLIPAAMSYCFESDTPVSPTLPYLL